MSIVRPTRPFSALPPDFAAYVVSLEDWCNHIEQLHANQARTLAGYQQDIEDHRSCKLVDAQTIAELRQMNETQMHRLSAMLDERRETLDVEAVRADNRRLRSDLKIISDELQAEAERRDWCSEYQEFCDRVNEQLDLAYIGPELRPFNVKHVYTVTVTGSVMAVDHNDARRKADAQYNAIHEGCMFRLPDPDVDDDDKRVIRSADADRGHLINLRWLHDDTYADNEGDNT